MRKAIVVLAALFVAAPAAAYYPGQIESRTVYYDDDNYRNQVGETFFYCDGSNQTTGLVTSSAVAEYYGCD